MGHWSGHVLINPRVVRVEHTVLSGQHVHGETVGRHELVLLGCTGPETKGTNRTSQGIV